jgi:hypothetical protein
MYTSIWDAYAEAAGYPVASDNYGRIVVLKPRLGMYLPTKNDEYEKSAGWIHICMPKVMYNDIKDAYKPDLVQTTLPDSWPVAENPAQYKIENRLRFAVEWYSNFNTLWSELKCPCKFELSKQDIMMMKMMALGDSK